MDPIWNETYLVRSYDVGTSGTLKPQVIFQYLQEAASNHAAHLGAGFEALRKLGLFWALSRIKVAMVALPAWGEEVTLTTWPKGIDRLFALRDFRMHDRRGNVLVRGTSWWLLLEMEKLRPRRIETLQLSYLLNDTEHALKESLNKLVLPPKLTPRYERLVLTSDLDVNHHVNNTEYVRWIADAIDPPDGTPTVLRTLQVNYLEEARLGETLLFSAGRDPQDGGTIYVEGVNRGTGTKVVQARAELGT
jgi:medium-chain acyl-[acyl-carrier-protein] hydrolase